MRVEDALQAQVDLLAMSQEFIQLLFPEHGTQSGLRELRSLIHVIGDFHHCFIRIDHPQEDHSVDLQRDIVARNDVLRRNFQCFLP